jgi:hypothetical protein
MPALRQGSVLPARSKTVAMLCLGADVELNVAPASGFPSVSRNGALAKSVSAPLARQSAIRVDEDDDWDPFGSPLTSEDEALSTRLAASLSRNRVKASKQPESMLVTLVHGDMLLFSGDDFEVSTIALSR